MRELHAALEKHGRRAWVDWGDLPLSARFMDEIRAAIESADVFLFVISPDSAGSPICREEIEHAVALHKPAPPGRSPRDRRCSAASRDRDDQLDSVPRRSTFRPECRAAARCHRHRPYFATRRHEVARPRARVGSPAAARQLPARRCRASRSRGVAEPDARRRPPPLHAASRGVRARKPRGTPAQAQTLDDRSDSNCHDPPSFRPGRPDPILTRREHEARTDSDLTAARRSGDRPPGGSSRTRAAACGRGVRHRADRRGARRAV